MFCKKKVELIKPRTVFHSMFYMGLLPMGITVKRMSCLIIACVGVIHDVYTCHVYVIGLCKHNIVEAELKKISCMEEWSCKHILITYKILLKALWKNGELSRVRELVSHKTLKGVWDTLADI